VSIRLAARVVIVLGNGRTPFEGVEEKRRSEGV